MNTPQKIIELAIYPFCFDSKARARNVLDALEAAGYCVMQKRAWPHHAITEVHRDGEMRAM